MVREYFELHGFYVRQHRKYVAPFRQEEEEIDFLVINPRCQDAAAGADDGELRDRPQPERASLPFVLGSADLRQVERAIVEVKGWHESIFSAAVLMNAPEIFRFVEPAALQRAARSLGGGGRMSAILVIPSLPQNAEAREQSIQYLRSKGVDAVLSFRTILADLIAEVEVNRNYQKSDLLQIIRVLKNYDFFKEPQLELFRSKRKKAPKG